MINSPNDSGQDWDNMIDEVKSNVLKKLINSKYQFRRLY